MKSISLEPVFMPPTTDVGPLRSRIKKSRGGIEIIKALEESPFDISYDHMRTLAAESMEKGELDKAVTAFTELSSKIDEITEQETDNTLSVHAAVMQVLTALLIERGDTDGAAVTAARALNLLAQQPRRKDPPFLQVLGALLYDVAHLHSERGEYKQAEREIEKSIKIFERLAKTDAARYAAPHVMALNGATAVYRNRVKQAELLAHYQAATSSYLMMVNSGAEEAAARLAESLTNEGDTLARMGRHREAVQYYTRAMKYLTKVETDFTLRQLRLSIALGESMISVAAMRDKGVHLLNTMLHKATKLNAADQHRRIVDSLVNAKSRSLDILGLWHKVFPK